MVIVLDDGDIVWGSLPYGFFQWGIIDNQTVKLTRQQSIYYLNKWINFYYELAKKYRNYRYDVRSTSYFYKSGKNKFEACPRFDLNDYMGLLKNGDMVNTYYCFGYSTDNEKNNLYITEDHELVVLCPADETPCVDMGGIPNFNMYLRFDIEYYLPK